MTSNAYLAVTGNCYNNFLYNYKLSLQWLPFH